MALSAMIFALWSGSLRRSLAQRLDALGAKHLMHDSALFHDQRFLQVRFERAIRGALRK